MGCRRGEGGLGVGFGGPLLSSTNEFAFEHMHFCGSKAAGQPTDHTDGK